MFVMAQTLSFPSQNMTGIQGCLAFASDASTYYANKWGRVFVDLTHATEDSCHRIGDSLKKSFSRVGEYVKEHWKSLVIYTVVWGLIIVSSGILYGFNRTALPLTIGMSAGLGFGLITALLTTRVFDPQNKGAGTNTAVGWCAHHSLKVDPTTKQIALTILVAVYLAACIKFPHATGALTGAVIGNHLFVHLLCHKIKKAEQEKKENEEEVVKTEKERDDEIAQLRKEMDALKAQIAKPQMMRPLSTPA
jgi:hypothetical protein